ncbi:Type IV leader peptidase family protein [Lachnospiraceae bacterium C10]|jgi:leader peptidase (prepilin peptidase)/N-methyltransferase|nr:Type IV leader peptidase family protein [Lachnospiraceae bacterium C10]SDW53731.1 Type IV leader peptidase family protein [Lachnospiraceae bacterium KHCPX20]
MEFVTMMGMLGICSLEDIRSRQIRAMVIGLAGAMGVFWHLMNVRLSIWDMMGGGLVGCAVYLLSVMTGEKIGKGDAFVFMVTGIYLGLWDNVILLLLSSFLASVLAGIMVLFFHKKKTDPLPFVPCIFAGGVLLLICKGGGVF